MEPQKGLKSLLWDVLGLQPVVESDAGQPQQHAASTADSAEIPQQQPDAGPDVAAHEPAASTDEHDAAFAARLASIKQHFTSDAAAARDAQQLLQEAHKQAQRKEAEVLEAVDAAYTPAWRRTGLPSKASQLQLDEVVLSASKLLNPAAVVARQQAHQQKEVLQPPAVFAYCDKSAAPHFLQTTGNQKVRQGIVAARITAKSQKQLSSPQPQRHGTQAGSRSSPQRTRTQAAQQAGQSSSCRQVSPSRKPWLQLPAEEAAANVVEATARYKAMAAIMTPEQQQIEEKIIKSMYQRLSYLRNPRYAVPQGSAGRSSMAPTGSSTAHKQRRHTQGSSKSTAAQPAQYGTRATLTATEAGFSVVPAQGVLFDAYAPGGVYFQTVQLQNVGTIMKQLRLLPPISKYFQISFPRFPLESSALAPGMCAEVDVCFTPDSLGDFEDSFSVESPAGRFEVQLTGRRPHPNLTLPPVLEVGDVLIGNKRSHTFEFVNKGGDGRFLLLTAQQWAAALQQTGQDSSNALSAVQAADSEAAGSAAGQPLESGSSSSSQVPAAAVQVHAADVVGFGDEAPAAVNSGPFSISPAYLDLPAGAAAVLAVEFSPQAQGLQSGDFMLVCDNCTAHPLRVEGYGEQVQVQLVGLDDREWLQQDGQMPLWFGQVCPGANSKRRLRVSNATELPLPFRWAVQSTSQAVAFTVSPAAGVLQAKAEQEFTVDFAPPSVAAHSAGLTLSVQRSGDAGLLSISQWGRDGTAIVDVDLAATGSTPLRATAAGRLLQDCSSVSSWAGVQAGPEVPEASSAVHRSSSAAQDSWPGSSAWDTVAQLGVEGLGTPISLAVLPTAAVRVPGVLTVGDEACLPLQLSNDTAAPAHFSIAAATHGAAAAAADVCIVPSEGVVPPHGVLQLAAHFTAVAAGRHQQTVIVQVLHGQDQQLHTSVNVQQVKVLPSVPTMDFGVLCVGASASRPLQLHSTAANSRSFWSLRQHGDQACVPPTVLSFQPSYGWLDPLASCETVVTVTGSCEGPQRLLIRVSSNSNTCSSCSRSRVCEADAAKLQAGCSCRVGYVQVLVLVSAPKVALSKYRLPIQHAYTGVPQHHSIVMTNTSSLPLTFNWVIKQLQHQHALKLQEQLHPQPQSGMEQAVVAANVDSLQQSAISSSPTGADDDVALLQEIDDAAGQIQLAVTPSTGQLAPGESVRLQLQLEPTAVGPVALLCCCQVPAMSQLVGFLVTAQVGGLQVQYRIMRPEDVPAQPQQQQQAGSRANSPSGRRASSPTGRHSKQSSRVGSAAASAAQAGQQQLVQFNSSSSAARHVAYNLGQSAGSAVLTESAQSSNQVLAAGFGVLPLHQPAELLLQVTNLTSIPSTVRAWMGHFAARQLSTGTAFLGSRTAGQSSSTWPFAGETGAYSTQQEGAAAGPAHDCRARSPLRSAGSQLSDPSGRSSSPCSPSLSAHRRQGSPQPKGQLSAAAVAGKLSRTDPCTYTGSRDSSVAIPAEAIISTVSTISSQGSKQGPMSGTGGGSSSMVLKGPFRAFAGNAMMAARQAAAAAAAALGSDAYGCAVQLLPDACELPGWGSCMLRLQAFNNLPGSYVDTLFVQVGELPPKQIPMSLQVVGSPLVISKHRVQRQASEVLHTLMQHHHQQLLAPPAQTQALSTAGAAAGCGGMASTSSSGSAVSQDTKAACALDFGIVTAGLPVQKTLYVSNTGALPVQLAWDWPAAAKRASTAGDSSDSASGTSEPEAAPAAPADAELSPAQGEDLDSSRPESASAHDTGSSKRPSSTSSTKAGAQAGKAAAGVGKKGVVPAPVTTRAAKPATANQQAQRPAAGAGAALAARVSERKEAVSVAEAPAEQQQEHKPAEAPATEAAPAAADTAVDGAGSVEAATAAAAAAEPAPPVPDELTVVSCEALLPPGGPSSLLRALQQISPSTAQPAAGVAADTDAVSSAAAEQHGMSATSLFSITPQMCMIPAGGQQQFTVSFCSSEARAVQQLVLQGSQSLCQPAGAEGQQECGLKLHLLPSQLASNSSGGSQQQDPVAAVQPVKCCITGGFHPHAGPPPRPMPALTAALSAVAVAPQLTASDPDCFRWRVTTTHDPSTHASYLQTATLCNGTGCPLVFRLAVEGAFELVAAMPSVEQNVDAFRGMLGSDSLPAKLTDKAASTVSKQGPAGGLLLLPPGEAVDVSIRFRPGSLSREVGPETRMQSAASGSLSSNSGTRCSIAWAPAGPAQSAAVQLQDTAAEAGGSSHVPDEPYTGRYTGALVVAYHTGQQQVVALHADLLQPHLLVSPESKVLEFGGVHAAAPRMLEVVITNPTEADAAWTATVRAAAASATAGRQLGPAAASFTVSPRQGILAGRGLGMPKQTRSQVMFAPACSGPCVAELFLAVRGGGEVAVVLKGTGVHAEHAELRAGYDL